MAVKKFSVNHFLNTRLKAHQGNKYPVYIRIIYNKTTNATISHLLKNVYLTEKEFEVISENEAPADDNLKSIQKHINSERETFSWIFNYLSKIAKDISVYDFPYYFDMFKTNLQTILNLKTCELLRSELCEFLHKKTGLRYRTIDRMLINENALDIDDLLDKESGYPKCSKELLKYMIVEDKIENFQNQYAENGLSVLQWLYGGGREFYSQQKEVSKISLKYSDFLDEELIEFSQNTEKVTFFIDTVITTYLKQEIISYEKVRVH